MPSPPKHMSPATLFASLTEMPRPIRRVDFPRKRPDGTPVGQVAIRVLTQEERLRASAEAERWARELLSDPDARKTFESGDVYENCAACTLLHLACRDTEDPERPVFPTPKAIAEVLTVDEVAMMLRHYTTVQAELGPIVATMTEDEVDAWIERIAKAGDAFPFDLLSPAAQGQLASSMARRLSRSRMGTSSPSSEFADGARATPLKSEVNR